MNILAYVHMRNIVNSTGAGRVARQMTEALSRIDGVHLRVLADAGDHEKFTAAAGEPWTGFDYRLFSSDTSKQQARWYFLKRPRGESYWPAAHIVYCTGESYVPARTSRLVVTVHDAALLEDQAAQAGPRQRALKLKRHLLLGRLSKTADMLHTVSQFSADRLAHFFPAMRNRLRVVHNAVSETFFSKPGAEGEKYLSDIGLRGRKFILLPGGLHYRKNAELVLSAWPELAARDPDLLLAVVNHSNPAYAARAAALGERVRLLGYVSDEQLHALYSSASVVWFPSRYEGFGMPVLEGMACGAPVVASDSSSLPEVAGGAAVLVSPLEPSRHAEALHWLLNDSGARTRYVELGRLRAAGFHWNRAALRLHAEFAGLI